MRTLSKETIQEIEKAIKLHINYAGNSTGGYLKIMDRLSVGYPGSLSQKVSSLLDDYYKKVNVKSLDEAMDRLRKLDKKGNI